MTTMFVGDVGTEIILDCGVNITTTTVRNIVVIQQTPLAPVLHPGPDLHPGLLLPGFAGSGVC